MVEQILDGGGGHGARPGMGQMTAPTCYAAAEFYKEGQTQSRMPEEPKQHQKTDLSIGGAGFAGLALANRAAPGRWAKAFAVTVVDPALGAAQSKDPRASAIAAAARRLFEAIEVWDAVADKRAADPRHGGDR